MAPLKRKAQLAAIDRERGKKIRLLPDPLAWTFEDPWRNPVNVPADADQVFRSGLASVDLPGGNGINAGNGANRDGSGAGWELNGSRLYLADFSGGNGFDAGKGQIQAKHGAGRASNAEIALTSPGDTASILKAANFARTLTSSREMSSFVNHQPQGRIYTREVHQRALTSPREMTSFVNRQPQGRIYTREVNQRALTSPKEMTSFVNRQPQGRIYTREVPQRALPSPETASNFQLATRPLTTSYVTMLNRILLQSLM